MNTQAENEVLNEAMWELESQAQWKPTLANDESSSQPDTTVEWWADETEETTSEVSDSLFEEEAKQTPQVTDEQKLQDRERVKQATIDNSIKKVVSRKEIISELVS